MISFFRRLLCSSITKRPSSGAKLQLETLDDRLVPSTTSTPQFVQTNLVSNVAGMAENTDSNLVNPWGIAFDSGTSFWVSDNKTGLSTVYNGQGVAQPSGSPLQVTIPPEATGTGSPTGIVFNSAGTGFDITANSKTASSQFLFATLDGTISGWSSSVSPTNAVVAVTNSGAVFTGLAIGVDAEHQTLLYAVNRAKGAIDVYNSSFDLVTTLAGSFTDLKLPSGAKPYNIQDINGDLYVEYTVTGDGSVQGIVDEFTTDGKPVNKTPLIVGGELDSPWGITLAPKSFGKFGSDLLVGNFGNGEINAFNAKTGAFEGTLTLSTGQPFVENDLWGLTFNSDTGSSANTLYFTAGVNNETGGLFGSLQAFTSISSSTSVVKTLPTAVKQTFTTVPSNGDTNPYGVTFVPQGFPTTGTIQPGDVLVSNFNDEAGVQGTGTTIVAITPSGKESVFYQGSAGLGLTTALDVLKSGYVIVGNVPTNENGVAQQGSLLILNSSGTLVTTLTDATFLNGPWDMAVNDDGSTAQLFVSNVLSGTVTRVDLSIPTSGTPSVVSKTQIASGYAISTNASALVVGPTGLAFDATTDTLFVASTDNNAIFAITNALTTLSDDGVGRLISNNSSFLHGPLGIALAPNGDLIVSNGDAVNAVSSQSNEIVELSPNGDMEDKLVSSYQLDSGAAGAAFGVAVSDVNGVIRFASVDDNTNTVTIWTP